MALSARKAASFSRFNPLCSLLFSKSRTGLRYSELFSSIQHASRSKPAFNFSKALLQGLTSPDLRKKILKGCFAGISVTASIMCHPPNIAYAMQDYTAESAEDVTDDFNAVWALVRKYQLPLVMLVMLFLGWRHPIITAINAVFFLFCTRPSPFSIYLAVEQLRRRDVVKDPSLRNTKLFYLRKVEVEDYKLVCYGKVELHNRELHFIGILGGWWIFHESLV